MFIVSSPIHTLQTLFPFAGPTQRSKWKNPTCSYQIFGGPLIKSVNLIHAWSNQNTQRNCILLSKELQTSELKRLL